MSYISYMSYVSSKLRVQLVVIPVDWVHLLILLFLSNECLAGYPCTSLHAQHTNPK